ncbi:hypothetical protein D3C80_2172060 [compost metagenome]
MKRGLKLMRGLEQKFVLLSVRLPQLGRHILDGIVGLREAVGHNEGGQKAKA